MSDIMDRLLDTTDRDAVSDAREEIAALRAEVERLTGERDRQYDQNAEQIIRIAALEAENERLKGFEAANRLNAAQVKAQRAENERLRAALRGMVDNACAACDEDYVIRATKAEWDAHVKATAQARSALEEH